MVSFLRNIFEVIIVEKITVISQVYQALHTVTFKRKRCKNSSELLNSLVILQNNAEIMKCYDKAHSSNRSVTVTMRKADTITSKNAASCRMHSSQ